MGDYTNRIIEQYESLFDKKVYKRNTPCSVNLFEDAFKKQSQGIIIPPTPPKKLKKLQQIV